MPTSTETHRREAIKLLTRALCPLGEDTHRRKAVKDLSQTLWSLHPPDVTREYTDRLAGQFVDELRAWLRASGITRDVARELAEDIVTEISGAVIEETQQMMLHGLERCGLDTSALRVDWGLKAKRGRRR